MNALASSFVEIVDLSEHEQPGWFWAEALLPAGTAWPGYAVLLISPEGDIAIIGDSNAESASFASCYENGNEQQIAEDVRWARRVIGKPIAVWAS